LNIGKDSEKAEGYSAATILNDAYRLDQFYWQVWNRGDRYTKEITHEHADEYIKELAYGEGSNTHKANCPKVTRIF
jgi:hypothetical protein